MVMFLPHALLSGSNKKGMLTTSNVLESKTEGSLLTQEKSCRLGFYKVYIDKNKSVLWCQIVGRASLSASSSLHESGCLQVLFNIA